MTAPDRSRQLIFHGTFSFGLALVTGLVISLLPYPRVALAAHTTTLLIGMFLILVGAIWNRLELSPGAASLAVGLAIYGVYANWGVCMLGAFWGTGKFTPIVSQGRTGSPLHETVVGVILVTVAVANLILCGLILKGLKAGAGKG